MTAASEPTMFQDTGTVAADVVADHAQHRGHAVGFMRGQLHQIERARERLHQGIEAAKHEDELLAELASKLCADLARLGEGS